jgi:hypothetical protein
MTNFIVDDIYIEDNCGNMLIHSNYITVNNNVTDIFSINFSEDETIIDASMILLNSDVSGNNAYFSSLNVDNLYIQGQTVSINSSNTNVGEQLVGSYAVSNDSSGTVLFGRTFSNLPNVISSIVNTGLIVSLQITNITTQSFNWKTTSEFTGTIHWSAIPTGSSIQNGSTSISGTNGSIYFTPYSYIPVVNITPVGLGPITMFQITAVYNDHFDWKASSSFNTLLNWIAY